MMPRAQRDMVGVYEWGRDHFGVQHAMQFVSDLQRRFSVLLDHPHIGRKGRQPNTRELVISDTPFIAVYRLQANRIEVLRILHGVQAWP